MIKKNKKNVKNKKDMKNKNKTQEIVKINKNQKGGRNSDFTTNHCYRFINHHDFFFDVSKFFFFDKIGKILRQLNYKNVFIIKVKIKSQEFFQKTLI